MLKMTSCKSKDHIKYLSTYGTVC